MTTATLVKKLNKDVSDLQKDMAAVKQLLMAPPRDPEGKYRSAFVRRVLRRARTRGPVYRFTTKEAFLRHVRASSPE